MVKNTKNKNILIGVCGGISSYKVAQLIRLLCKGGFSVKVMMTESATKFISPLVFQELSKNPVYLDMFKIIDRQNTKHISLAQWADLCVIAPASANTISKVASGIADNLLTTVVCALGSNTKALFAPAMNENMWRNPIIQENIKKLEKFKKYTFMPVGKGELACGSYGEGRMPEVKDIYKKINSLLK